MTVFRFRSAGRSRNYPRTHAFVEIAMRLAYPVPWPAWIGGWVPGMNRVQTTRHRLAVLPPDTSRSLRVAFLSDLHVGPVTPPGVVKDALQIARLWRPDVLVLGGDYFFLDATPRRCDFLRGLLEHIDAPHKIAVLGNHDLWCQTHLIEAMLAEAGFQTLVNDSLVLADPFADVAVIGLDDPWAGSVDVERPLAAAGPRCRLVFCHSPEILPALHQASLDLLVCGHTHGGQIAIPPARPWSYRGPIGREYIGGLYTAGKYPVVVSRGVGCVSVPIRLFAPPEVVLLELMARGAGPAEDA